MEETKEKEKEVVNGPMNFFRRILEWFGYVDTTKDHYVDGGYRQLVFVKGVPRK